MGGTDGSMTLWRLQAEEVQADGCIAKGYHGQGNLNLLACGIKCWQSAGKLYGDRQSIGVFRKIEYVPADYAKN